MDDTVQRLTELLAKKDEEIEELKARWASAQERDDYLKRWDEWGWTIPSESASDGGLPVPRLELRWELLDERGYNRICRYSLVYKHLLSYFVSVPLGSTRVNGHPEKPVGKDGNLEVPFRDGSHVVHDARQLDLPVFITWEEFYQELDIHAARGFKYKGMICEIPTPP